MYQFHNDHDSSQPPSQPVARPQRTRRLGTAALLGLALTTSAVGGGVAGATAVRWLVPERSSATTLAPQPIAQVQQGSNTAGAVYSAVGPSIVEISVQGNVGRFQGTYGGGTGFVVDTDGLIVTNQHVIASASNVSVTFSNGEERSATVLGTDSTNDLALLRVDNMPSGIPAAPLGDSDQVEVGEIAIAIGSPFGLEQSVTQGIVSAVNRNWSPGGRAMRGLIQTDAPINPGNSGGPLLNANGEVIGVTTLIESPVRGNVGVGFAVPVNTLQQMLPQLEAGANLEQGYMGVTTAQAAPNAQQDGVQVGAVEPGSGADQAGVQPGDVITAIDGNAITDFEDLVVQLNGRQPGEAVTLTIQRNGQQQQVEVTLGTRPEQPTE